MNALGRPARLKMTRQQLERKSIRAETMDGKQDKTRDRLLKQIASASSSLSKHSQLSLGSNSEPRGVTESIAFLRFYYDVSNSWKQLDRAEQSKAEKFLTGEREADGRTATARRVDSGLRFGGIWLWSSCFITQNVCNLHRLLVFLKFVSKAKRSFL